MKHSATIFQKRSRRCRSHLKRNAHAQALRHGGATTAPQSHTSSTSHLYIHTTTIITASAARGTPVAAVDGCIHLNAQVALRALSVPAPRCDNFTLPLGCCHLLAKVNARHHTGCDGYAFAAQRVPDHVHLLLQAGAGAQVQLHRIKPESGLLDGQQREVHLKFVSRSYTVLRLFRVQA
jgi:hypothetical protein